MGKRAFVSDTMADINVEEVLKKLTVAEKVDLLAGEYLDGYLDSWPDSATSLLEYDACENLPCH